MSSLNLTHLTHSHHQPSTINITLGKTFGRPRTTSNDLERPWNDAFGFLARFWPRAQHGWSRRRRSRSGTESEPTACPTTLPPDLTASLISVLATFAYAPRTPSPRGLTSADADAPSVLSQLDVATSAQDWRRWLEVRSSLLSTTLG